MRIIAIDPGNIKSAWVIFEKAKLSFRDGIIFKIISCGKEPNEWVLSCFDDFNIEVSVIEEMVAYGKWSGREVTDTAFWVGRFYEASHTDVFLINRPKIRWHIGGQKKVTDAIIIERLIERFCPVIYDNFVTGKLTKNKMINAAREEYFKGFHDDIWQAFALGVTWYDLNVN